MTLREAWELYQTIVLGFGVIALALLTLVIIVSLISLVIEGELK